MANGFQNRTIEVDGQSVVVDCSPDSDLWINDLTSDMARVAALIAYWASVRASATKERRLCDAAYRSWKARAKLAVITSAPKLAEWKVAAQVESEPKFLEFQAALATADSNVELCGDMVTAFCKKANVLQSRGATARQELERQGLTTRADDFPESWGGSETAPMSGGPRSDSERMKAVRNLHRRKTTKQGE
jgi:hypothetical protein